MRYTHYFVTFALKSYRRFINGQLRLKDTAHKVNKLPWNQKDLVMEAEISQSKIPDICHLRVMHVHQGFCHALARERVDAFKDSFIRHV